MMELIGHASRNMLDHYSHVRMETKRRPHSSTRKVGKCGGPAKPPTKERGEICQLIENKDLFGGIRYHYDMFPDNAADPEQFRATLAIRAPESRYQKLVHGEPFILPGA